MKLRYSPRFLAGAILLIGILACASQVSGQPPLNTINVWQDIFVSEEFAHPGQTPVLLSNTIIWRPFESDTLLYQPLTGDQAPLTYDWLRGTPLQWAVASLSQHLILAWRDTGDNLWVARLFPDGQQDSAPILIAGDNVTDFKLIALPGEEALLLFQINGLLQYTLLDPATRPVLPITLQADTQRFTAAVDDAFQIHLVWQSEDRLTTGILDHAAGHIMETRTLQEEFPAEISDIELLMLENQAFVIWSVISDTAPDVEQINGLTFSPDTEPAPFSIVLPDDPPLRWMSAYGNQLTLTAYIESQWRPVVIQFDQDRIANVTVLDSLPVNGGGIAANSQGQLGWITLDEQLMPRVVVIGQVEEPLTPGYPAWQTALRQGLQVSYLSVLWLVAPLVSFYRSREQWFELPAVLFSYWLSKAVLAFDLFDQKPTTLQSIDFPLFLLTAAALAGITLAAISLASIGWGRSPRIFRYATYCLTDALLTFAIFGADVQSARLFGG